MRLQNILWMFLLLLLNGCFKPRKADPPAPQVQIGWISPVEYSQLVQNFILSVDLLNSQNHLRCYSQTGYKYYAASSLVNQNQLVWNNWSLIEEREYIENISKNLLTQSYPDLKLEQVGIIIRSAFPSLTLHFPKPLKVSCNG